MQELVAQSGIDEAPARSWIEGGTGSSFDSRRRYRLRLPRVAGKAQRTRVGGAQASFARGLEPWAPLTGGLAPGRAAPRLAWGAG